MKAKTANKVVLFSESEVNDESTTGLVNQDFLDTGSLLPNNEFNEIESQLPENYETMKAKEVIQDIETLPKTKLNAKYPLTYSRWKNAKSRKKQGAIIDPRFQSFSDFLGYMGPVPNRDYTLDRIDNNNRTYSPENCRWADKYTQNSNKGNNVYVTYDGETHTIAQWAALTQQKPNTLYKRKREGWADDEIVTGIREKLEASPWSKTPWPRDKELSWERSYQKSDYHLHNKSRLDFLVDHSKTQLSSYKRKCEEDAGSDERLMIDLEYWNQLYKKSQELQMLRKRRKQFISRNGKNDPAEAALFDLVNPNPMTFDDISAISRSELSENSNNQKEPSE